MWPACRAPAAALALLAGSLLAVVMSDAEADKLNACRDLGFTGSQLCSTCDELAAALGEQGARLVDDCLGCCVEGAGAAAGQRYPYATLEVCRHRLSQGLLPAAVEKFVRTRAGGQLAGLALAHRLGAVPRIRLYGAGGEGESARIDRWQLEDIEAYLADRLEGYAPAAAM